MLGDLSQRDFLVADCSTTSMCGGHYRSAAANCPRASRSLTRPRAPLGRSDRMSSPIDRYGIVVHGVEGPNCVNDQRRDR